MIQVIEKINHKVEKLQKNKTSGGYVNGSFPGQNDAYPCLADFSFAFWQKTWHMERGMEYYKSDGYWLTTQVFSVTVLAKETGKIFPDLEYYAFIESISVLLENTEEADEIFINVNGEEFLSVDVEASITTIPFNYLLLLGEYLTVYTSGNEPAIVQVKYRLVG